MKIRKEAHYHSGFEAHYHHEIRLYPEYAPFWTKFYVLLGKPLLVHLVLSYICFLFGGYDFLDVQGFLQFLIWPPELWWLVPFVFIWMAVMMIQMARVIAAEHQGEPFHSNGAWVLYFMASIFLFAGIVSMFVLHYAL